MIDSTNRRVTLKTIADYTGVSKTIVSKIVNNNPTVRVRPETRKRVLKAVKEFNYYPLGAAQSLATSKTRQISFLLSSKITLGLANDYYAMILSGVQKVCSDRNYQCIINVYDFDNIDNFIMPENLRKRSIDGCLLVGLFDPRIFEILNDINIPLVAIGGRTDKKNVPVFSRDIKLDYQSYFDYFVKMGHSYVWIETTKHPSWSNKNILELKNPHLHFELKESENSNFDEFEFGQDVAKKWMSLKPSQRPSLVFGSDQWCVSFLATLQKNGFNCPEDVSIVAGTDTQLCKWHYPAITTFSYDQFRLGFLSANLLLDILDEKITYNSAVSKAGNVDILSKLTERDSVSNKNNK